MDEAQGRMTVQELRDRLESARLVREIAIVESSAFMLQNWVDPREDTIDPITGEPWLPIGQRVGKGADATDTFTRDNMLRTARALELENPFAVNVLGNTTNYSVGVGIRFTAEKRDDDVSDDLLEDVQREIDIFYEQIPLNMAGQPDYENDDEDNFGQFQQEFVNRAERDGETFVRMFTDFQRGTVALRFVDPEDVKEPDQYIGDPAHSFGIYTDPEDAQDIFGYWMAGELVPASDVIHYKVNVDSNVKRGVSTLWPVRHNLHRADRLLRNMSTMAGVRAAVAMVTQYENATRDQVRGFADERADAMVVNSKTGKTRRAEVYRPGSHIRVPKGQKAEFPSMNTSAAELVEVVQAELRAVAARCQLPEYMVSADASNSNYASSLVAESPTVKKFSGIQSKVAPRFVRMCVRHLIAAVFVGRLSPAALSAVRIGWVAPSLVVRNRLQETQANQIMNQFGALSVETWMVRDGLEPESEMRRVEDEEAARAQAVPPVPPLPDDGDGDEQ